MATLAQIFDADLAAAEAEMPVTFVFNDAEYTGQKDEVVTELAMEDAGFNRGYDFHLIVRVAAFVGVTAPDAQDFIQIDGVKYRIDKLTPSQDGVAVTYAMKAEN